MKKFFWRFFGAPGAKEKALLLQGFGLNRIT